jgi:hypothetical protein
MAIRLNNNMVAAFNDSKSPLVANVLIERDYIRTREYGPGDEKGLDVLLIGTLYLLLADENTYPLMQDAEAFVLKMEHEPRLVDYFVFPDVAGAEAFMTAKG